MAFSRCMWVGGRGPLFRLGWTISPSPESTGLLEGWLVPALKVETWAFWVFSLFEQINSFWGADPTRHMPGTGGVTFKSVLSFNPFNNPAECCWFSVYLFYWLLRVSNCKFGFVYFSFQLYQIYFMYFAHCCLVCTHLGLLCFLAALTHLLLYNVP